MCLTYISGVFFVIHLFYDHIFCLIPAYYLPYLLAFSHSALLLHLQLCTERPEEPGLPLKNTKIVACFRQDTASSLASVEIFYVKMDHEMWR